MIRSIKQYFQKKREAKREKEYAARASRTKIGRHHPLHNVVDGIGDFIEDAIKWD